MKRAVSLAIASIYFSGCATIFHGSTDQITIRSNEPGTKIYVDEQEVGRDSAIWAVPKKGNHSIRVAKTGCTDTVVPIKYSFDGVSLLGILLDFGLISMLIVDGAGTGAISKADQTAYILTPNCSVASVPSDREPAQSSAGTVKN
jgi:hypothetical protein